MTEQKKDADKISDITDEKELNEKELQDVSGGLYVKRTFATKDNCGGNCAGSVDVADGKVIDF